MLADDVQAGHTLVIPGFSLLSLPIFKGKCTARVCSFRTRCGGAAPAERWEFDKDIPGGGKGGRADRIHNEGTSRSGSSHLKTCSLIQYIQVRERLNNGSPPLQQRHLLRVPPFPRCAAHCLYQELTSLALEERQVPGNFILQSCHNPVEGCTLQHAPRSSEYTLHYW